jgi:hypothetical protein
MTQIGKNCNLVVVKILNASKLFFHKLLYQFAMVKNRINIKEHFVSVVVAFDAGFTGIEQV